MVLMYFEFRILKGPHQQQPGGCANGVAPAEAARRAGGGPDRGGPHPLRQTRRPGTHADRGTGGHRSLASAAESGVVTSAWRVPELLRAYAVAKAAA